ncbi:hypothetical protein SASPL_127068 [Salvia splendens]|uniref:Uncharacterized protein n=1 Tax=Salvia splendens TaxID=180675 RepID=A0A8X8XM04_SALSN|nr:hypothetical protein SASPL_127068 [Salvia splendens]
MESSRSRRRLPGGQRLSRSGAAAAGLRQSQSEEETAVLDAAARVGGQQLAWRRTVVAAMPSFAGEKKRGRKESCCSNLENINSSECEEDKEFPSTTTSQSCSDVNYVPPIRENCSGPEARYLRSEKPGFTVRESKKAESSNQSPVKKCRLVLKLNNTSEPRSIEDSALVSKTMASKGCPVCKTFSSSSNTTLNAHIDQCLSGESTIKWTKNSKVIKHRIKPRKTRMMVNIYETVLCCTLEDLDKRNGTNWASNKGLLQPQDLEVPGEEEEENKKTYLPLEVEHLNQEDAVYIDSSSTEL